MADHYYDQLAPGYDRLHKEEQLRKLQVMLSWLKTQRIPEGDCLDVGCGTGFNLDLLHASLHRSCIGIDPSKGMLAQYRGNQQVLQAAAEDLPFPDDSFSLLVSVTAAQNFTDIPSAFAEMRRVLRPGGILALSCLQRSNQLGLIAASIAENFVVEEVIEASQDLIFFCHSDKVPLDKAH